MDPCNAFVKRIPIQKLAYQKLFKEASLQFHLTDSISSPSQLSDQLSVARSTHSVI